MSRKKTLPSIAKPFAHVHSTLATLGFTKSPALSGVVYELSFRDPSSSREYPFRLYAQTQDNGLTHINLNEATFAGKGEVPAAITGAAREILVDIADYLDTSPSKTKFLPVETAMNGHMASNEEEVRRLGRSMAKLPTNAKIRAGGMHPDPVQ
ncbi:hypothetical protein SAMN02799630_02267 [Paenibacillus sp. UNCCL117]|uniref:hypothetical protein n=1 Tax=unclassified Paenibacillus TaxID=185978 RepID=UPI00088ECFDC|nr:MULTISPECIES: hypothetical protein [unclassified Paenibacillus]SDD15705.1 hypothetical protein SAMN04488602_106143 [Paenibacillus sp. cl123]SFW34515.1 hypothetical protein SAMN02799630_02267 [Paenibacillus sp. UNCCL117]